MKVITSKERIVCFDYTSHEKEIVINELNKFNIFPYFDNNRLVINPSYEAIYIIASVLNKIEVY